MKKTKYEKDLERYKLFLVTFKHLIVDLYFLYTEISSNEIFHIFIKTFSTNVFTKQIFSLKPTNLKTFLLYINILNLN